MKENLHFYAWGLIYEFLSLKNDVNVPSKRNKHKTFLWGLEAHLRKEQDAERDPLV